MRIELFIGILLITICHGEEESERHGTLNQVHYDSDGEHNEDFDHEAILGSEDAVEEFSHLSPEDAKERLAQLVHQMDEDNSGTIEIDELVNWIKRSLVKLNIEESEESMEQDDTDKDGSLTWEEHIYAVYKMDVDSLKEYQESELDDPEAKALLIKNLKYDKAKFNAADENKDNQLSLEEYSAFLHPYDYDRMSEVESERVMDEYDTDKDGKIQLKEYLKNPVFETRNEEDLTGTRENFNHNDEDSNGYLDKDEVLKWVAPNIESIASEEAAHLMEASDTSRDGSLTKDEILDQHDLWVGSEATDYGELLMRDEL